MVNKLKMIFTEKAFWQIFIKVKKVNVRKFQNIFKQFRKSVFGKKVTIINFIIV